MVYIFSLLFYRLGFNITFHVLSLLEKQHAIVDNNHKNIVMFIIYLESHNFEFHEGRSRCGLTQKWQIGDVIWRWINMTLNDGVKVQKVLCSSWRKRHIFNNFLMPDTS